MTTPEEITALFALASNNSACISSQPLDDAINDILLAVTPHLHDIDYDVAGTQNLVGLVQDTASYTMTWGQPWANPACPAAYDPNINEAATRVVQNQMEAAHKSPHCQHCHFSSSRKGSCQIHWGCSRGNLLKDLKDPITFFNNVSAQTLMTNGMEPEDLVAMQTAMSGYYNDCERVPKCINSSKIKLGQGNLPMSDPQVLAIASASVFASQHFVRANEDWECLVPASKTWASWKTMYLLAHRIRARLIQAQGGGNIGNANSAGTFALPPATPLASQSTLCCNARIIATAATDKLKQPTHRAES